MKSSAIARLHFQVWRSPKITEEARDAGSSVYEGAESVNAETQPDADIFCQILRQSDRLHLCFAVENNWKFLINLDSHQS